MTLLLLTLAPKTPEAARRLADGLQRLRAEDAALEVRAGESEGEVVLGAASERQLEHALDRLAREFHVEAMVGRPQVAFTETVSRAADGEMKYSDRGEYAHVKVRVYPGVASAESVVDNQIIGGAIPEEFLPAIEAGVRERLCRGIIGGYPVRGIRIDLVDGSYHDTDSTPAAFNIAASRAVREALFMADCVLLEPLMRVSLSVPADCADTLATEIVQRRGRVHSLYTQRGTHEIRAIVPLAELFGFEPVVRSLTKGRGSCDMDFAGYAPLQRANGNDEDRGSIVTAPRRPSPPLRQSSLALPEPDDDSADD